MIQTLFIESIHYLLLEETNVGEKISQMLFPTQCSFPQLFQIPLSKKHSEKYMMYLTANNDKRSIANAILELVPIKPRMTFPMKYSLMTLSFFR